MTYENELFQERVVRVERPSAHWTLLRVPNGEFLGASDDGLAVFDYVDDKAIWESVEGGTAYRHVVTDLVLEAKAAGSEKGCYLQHNGTNLPVTVLQQSIKGRSFLLGMDRRTFHRSI